VCKLFISAITNRVPAVPLPHRQQQRAKCHYRGK